MRVPAATLTVLCLVLNGCGGPLQGPGDPPPDLVVVDHRPARLEPVARAQAIGDFVVVRKAASVSVLARADGKRLWSVPERADDPVVRARLAQGSIVVVRRSRTAEVYDLRSGTLRFSKENAGAVGVTWTMLFADSAACQPDCQLRGYNLATGDQSWVGPKALPGKVMTEPGDSPESQEQAGEPLRAPERSVIAVRVAEGVVLLDAASGQELARGPALEGGGMVLGSDRTLVQWTVGKDCKAVVSGRDLYTGEITWQAETHMRLLGMPTPCGAQWRPEISDGLFIVSDAQKVTKAIDIATAKVFWNGPGFDDSAVAVTRRAILTQSSRRIVAMRPDLQNPAATTRMWTVDLSGASTVAGVILDFDRLLYTTEYVGSPHGLGWVRDMSTGRRLWYGDGLTPLGVDGDRVIVETPSGEIRLDRMVSTG